MTDDLTFGALTVRVGGTPPVYDPGGATWVALGTGSAEDFAAVEEAARAAGAAQIVVPQGDVAVLQPLSYEPISDFWRGTVHGSVGAIAATKADLPFLLDLAAQRRAAYEQMQPVFWRPAADARDKQQIWFEHLLTRDDVRVLCDPEGFLIAMPAPDGWAVDDFVVASEALWQTAGRRLLEALDGTVTVVCACHDDPKRGLMQLLGFEPAYTWFQKSLKMVNFA